MLMSTTAILLPLFVLGLWTILILFLVGYRRVGAARRGRVRSEDFKFGESRSVPPEVSLPNRNYMNLLESPVLFYVVCIVLYVTGQSGAVPVLLAWFYVATRIVHSLIHLGYNHVLHRLAAFALSNLILLVLWMVAGIGVLTLTKTL